MSTTDFTAPPRLAVGSHPGSKTYMCAMNVISWENGDSYISDFPSCTPKPLARAIQHVNDGSCAHRDSVIDPDTGDHVRILCPPCSLQVLDLAHRTPGQPKLTMSQSWQWVAELLVGKHGAIHQLNDYDQREYVRQAALIATARAEERTLDPALFRRPLLMNSPALAQATQVHSFVGNVFMTSPYGTYSEREAIECAGVHHVLHRSMRAFKGEVGKVMIEDAHRMIDAWESVASAPKMPDLTAPKELAAA